LWCFITNPTPNPQAGGPPLVGCPRLLIQYIRSYPPKLEGVSSICNLRTRHAVVTRDPQWEYNETVHQLFVDFKKAYGSVRREVLYSILIEFEVPMKLFRLIKIL
jgi:hypothetical protein